MKLPRSTMPFLLLAASACASAGAAAPSLRFQHPEITRLSGPVDLDVHAPAGTTAVRYSMDGVHVAEITDLYARTTGTDPVWHTVTDAGWFPPGRHTLKAEADTPDGTVSARRTVVTSRPVPPRGVVPLNGFWEFAPASDLPKSALDGAVPASIRPGYARGTWRKVLVPGSLGAMRKEWNTFEGLIGVYGRTVTLAPPKAGECTALNFASIYWDGRVFVNGVEAGRVRGGYTPHRFDVTGFVRPGVNHICLLYTSRCV